MMPNAHLSSSGKLLIVHMHTVLAQIDQKHYQMKERERASESKKVLHKKRNGQELKQRKLSLKNR